MAIRFAALSMPRLQQEATFYNKQGQLDDNGKEAKDLLAQALNDDRVTAQGTRVGDIKASISDNVELSVHRQPSANPYDDGYRLTLHFKDAREVQQSPEGGDQLEALLPNPAKNGTEIPDKTVYLDGLRVAANELVDLFLAHAVNFTMAEKLSKILAVNAPGKELPEGFRPKLNLQVENQVSAQLVQALHQKLDGGHAKVLFQPQFTFDEPQPPAPASETPVAEPIQTPEEALSKQPALIAPPAETPVVAEGSTGVQSTEQAPEETDLWEDVTQTTSKWAHDAADFGQNALHSIKSGWLNGLKGLRRAIKNYENRH